MSGRDNTPNPTAPLVLLSTSMGIIASCLVGIISCIGDCLMGIIGAIVDCLECIISGALLSPLGGDIVSDGKPTVIVGFVTGIMDCICDCICCGCVVPVPDAKPARSSCATLGRFAATPFQVHALAGLILLSSLSVDRIPLILKGVYSSYPN